MNVNRLQIMFVVHRHCLSPLTPRERLTTAPVLFFLSLLYFCSFFSLPLPGLFISPPSIVVSDRWMLGSFVHCEISSYVCFPTVNLRFCVSGTLLSALSTGGKTGYRLSVSAERTARTPWRPGTASSPGPCLALLSLCSPASFPPLPCPHVISVMQIPD